MQVIDDYQRTSCFQMSTNLEIGLLKNEIITIHWLWTVENIFVSLFYNSFDVWVDCINVPQNLSAVLCKLNLVLCDKYKFTLTWTFVM